MTNLQPGQVNIRGKVYETVARRVHIFREKHPDWTMQTEIIESTEHRVVMVAKILDETGRLRSNGHAEEFRKASQINKTSATENCETSAIGRALAALGLGGREFSSANEVQNAIHQQDNIAQDLVQRVVDATLKHLKNNDSMGMEEVWAELSHEEQYACWSRFTTKQKAAIRLLRQEAAQLAQPGSQERQVPSTHETETA